MILQNPPPIGHRQRAAPASDEIVIRIDPDPGTSILLGAKQTGQEASAASTSICSSRSGSATSPAHTSGCSPMPSPGTSSGSPARTW